MLDSALVAHWKAKGLDFSKLFTSQEPAGGRDLSREPQDHISRRRLDRS
jgi:glutamate synthase (NADPH/NADH) large chain